MAVRIEVEGLGELTRALRRVDRELPRELRRETKRAADRVAVRAQQGYRRAYRQRTGKHARRIRATASQRSAAVLYGGARYPEAPGQEFGSNRYPQFAPWTGQGPGGRGSRGRFLFPAAQAEAPRFGKQVERSLRALLKRAGLR